MWIVNQLQALGKLPSASPLGPLPFMGGSGVSGVPDMSADPSRVEPASGPAGAPAAAPRSCGTAPAGPQAPPDAPADAAKAPAPDAAEEPSTSKPPPTEDAAKATTNELGEDQAFLDDPFGFLKDPADGGEQGHGIELGLGLGMGLTMGDGKEGGMRKNDSVLNFLLEN